MLLHQIGSDGQKKLTECTAVIVGMGGLGCTVATNFARVGIGNIKIVDRDCVELNNVHRQILFDEPDIDQPKVIVASEKLRKINSEIHIEPILKDVNFSNIEHILKDADIVVDGTDNMETRFLVNDACVKNDIPWIYGGAIGTYGMCMNIIPHETPCLRCFIQNIPRPGTLPTCDMIGVLPQIPMIIGAIESVEALKIILKRDDYNRHLLIYDVWTHTFHTINIELDEDCKCCSKHDFEFLNVKKRAIVTALCGRNTVQIIPIEKGDITFDILESKLKTVGDVKRTPFTLIFKASKYEITIFKDGRAMIKGTSDENVAKSLYARYIGT